MHSSYSNELKSWSHVKKKFNLLLWPHPIPGDQDWIKFESKLCKNFGLTDQRVFENSVSISFLYSYVKMHISNLTPLNFWVFWLTSLNLHSVRMISNNFRINRSKVLIKVLCINLFFFIFHKNPTSYFDPIQSARIMISTTLNLHYVRMNLHKFLINTSKVC